MIASFITYDQQVKLNEISMIPPFKISFGGDDGMGNITEYTPPAICRDLQILFLKALYRDLSCSPVRIAFTPAKRIDILSDKFKTIIYASSSYENKVYDSIGNMIKKFHGEFSLKNPRIETWYTGTGKIYIISIDKKIYSAPAFFSFFSLLLRHASLCMVKEFDSIENDLRKMQYVIGPNMGCPDFILREYEKFKLFMKLMHSADADKTYNIAIKETELGLYGIQNSFYTFMYGSSVHVEPSVETKWLLNYGNLI